MRLLGPVHTRPEWIAIESTSQCGSDGSRSDRDRVASVDSVAVGSRSDRDPVASVDRPL